MCIPVSVHHVELRWPHWTDLVSEITSYYLSAHNRSGMVHPYQERYLGTAAFATISTSETFALSRAVAIGIRGCDSVGLCSMAMSEEIHLVESVPQDGRVTIDPGGDASEGFLNQVARGLVGASWHSFKSGATSTADGTESAHGALTPTDVTALAYEACVGSTPFGCQAVPFTSTSSSTSWHADGLSLTCGSTYYVAVRATNCAGLQRTVSSAGAKLCCEPPTAGVVQLLDAAGEQVWYVGESAANHTNASWAGFTDMCSGVREYALSVEQVNAGTVLWSSSVYDGSTSHAVLPWEMLASLPEGVSLSVVVTATSHAGLSTRAKGEFYVDRTPPVARGLIFNGDMQHVVCQSAVTPFRVSWEQMMDPESGVKSIEWGLGYWPLGDDLLPFARVDGDAGSVVRERSAQVGHVKLHAVVYSTLRVRNGAGDAALLTSPPVRVIASNCSASFLCLAPSASLEPMLPWMLPLVA
uniref:Fibronectin type-III domain-containing protein n=1 Tax=Haptolina ericina TaxID=156174 RepID=A0A7S3BEN9_9EUKA